MTDHSEDDITTEPRRELTLRAAPLVMGATFVAIGTVALAVNPDGFGEQAIIVGSVAVTLLLAGVFMAAIAHLVSRRG